MALELDIEIKGADEFLRRLAETPDRFRRGMEQAGVHLASAVKLKLTGMALRVRTGLLRSSVTSETRGSYPVFETVVGTGVKYARIHEYGGVIVPRTKKVLRFEVEGKTVFARKVTLPARPYMEPTLREQSHVIERIVGEALVE